jgi:uncharacterized protein
MELSVKRKMVSVILAILLFGFVNPAFSETEKSKDIRKLLKASGILDQLSYMQDSLMNNVSMMVTGNFPKVPEAFWGDFNKLMGPKEMDELVERVIPVYEKHMSPETVKKLITMFETPFWNEWKEKMPQISRQAGQIGSEWGREITQSKAFNEKLESLIKKHDLEKLNPPPPEGK